MPVENLKGEVVLDCDLSKRKSLVSRSLRLDYFSPSFISAWDGCPARSVFDCLVPGERIAALDIGTAVHKLLEQKFQGQELDFTAAKDLVGEENYPTVVEYFNSYKKIEDEGAKEGQHFTERTITASVMPLGVDIGIPIKGVIDRLDISPSGVGIIDYKTSSSNPKKESYTDQVTIYKWLVEEDCGIPVDTCRVIVLSKNPKVFDYDIDLVTQSRLIDKIVRIKGEVENSLNDGHYKKCQSWKCKYCSHKTICENLEQVKIKD